MRLDPRTLASTAAALIIAVAPAAADPIRITAGALVYPASPLDISVNLAGDGFAFSGSARRMGMGFDPYQTCIFGDCVPGSTLSLHTFGTEQTYSFDTITYQGRTFTNLSGINARSGIETEWTGSLLIPLNFTGGVLTAPFSFRGIFHLTDDASGSFQTGQLTGSGIATVTFGPNSGNFDPNGFHTTAVRFDFLDTAPTPEPMSLLLVGTGLCGIVATRRRRAR